MATTTWFATPVSAQDACDYPSTGEPGNRAGAVIDAEQQVETDLRCVVLTGTSLGNVDFSRSDLRGARLDDSTWQTARLQSTRLDRADLSGATFSAVDFLGASFDAADLRGTTISASILDGADLSAALVSGVRITGSSARHSNWTDADLSGAVLRGSDLTDAWLRGADLSNADLTGATASTADFTDASFSGADLSGAVLRSSRLVGASLRGANLRGADLRGAALDRADLSGADLTGALIDDGSPRADLADATCPDGTAANDNTSFIAGANCNDHLGPPPADEAPTTTKVVDSTAAAVVVLDQSFSMGWPDGSGRTRIEAAVDGVQTIIGRMPTDLALGFLSYGGEAPCGVVHRIGAGYDNRDGIVSTVQGIAIDPRDVPVLGSRGTQGTPTALALSEAVDLLPATGARTIVLVSDGESNCTGDPAAVAEQLAADGIAVTVNTVGFQISAAGRDELQRIAAATGGEYADVTDSAELADRIEFATRAVADVVAMGDSFASGEGAADFIGEFGEPRKCHRSPRNISAQAVEQLRTLTGEVLIRVDVTCTGAVTADLSNESTKPAGEDGPDDDESYAPQFDGLDQLAPGGARHITLSIGGNDAKFGKVISECVLAGMPRGGELFLSWLIESFSAEEVPDRPGEGCEQRNTFGGWCEGTDERTTECTDEQRTVERGYFTEQYLGESFGPLLAATYDGLADRIAATEQAWLDLLGDELDTSRPVTVWVATYPLIFPDVESGDDSCNWISSDDLIWINARWRQANEVIRVQVAAANARAATRSTPIPIVFEVVDVESALAGHRLCEADPGDARATAGRLDGVWVNGIAKRNAKDEHERLYWFHPNELGHRAMGEVLARRMAGLPGPATIDAAAPPEVSLTIASATGVVDPGATVSVTAGPFEPGTTAYVAIASSPTLLAEVELMAATTVSIEVVIPPDIEPGDHEIIVYGESAAGFTRPVSRPLTIAGPPPTTAPVTSPSRVDAPEAPTPPAAVVDEAAQPPPTDAVVAPGSNVPNSRSSKAAILAVIAVLVVVLSAAAIWLLRGLRAERRADDGGSTPDRSTDPDESNGDGADE